MRVIVEELEPDIPSNSRSAKKFVDSKAQLAKSRAAAKLGQFRAAVQQGPAIPYDAERLWEVKDLLKSCHALQLMDEQQLEHLVQPIQQHISAFWQENAL